MTIDKNCVDLFEKLSGTDLENSEYEKFTKFVKKG